MIVKAACASSVGRVRTNNEDNLYFNGKYLPQQNEGIKRPLSMTVPDGECMFCVYDGMGGHESGEVASFIAASETKRYIDEHECLIIPTRQMLEELTARINENVFKAGRNKGGRLSMGTTGVMLKFMDDEVYVCNVGDSPAFRLRDSELLQLSVDHVENVSVKPGRKPALTQGFGMDPEEIRIEPHIAKGELEPGDQYLLCSDGLTDMVSKVEICSILKSCTNVKRAARKLVQKALDNGGKDNITVILCQIG